eukprot:scaffold17863_cov70-Skeletonema_dohrnii-CCMP3373.AAC.3
MDQKTNSSAVGAGMMKTAPLDSTAHQAVVKNATDLRRGRNVMQTLNAMSRLEMEVGTKAGNLGIRDLDHLDQ